MHAPSTGRLRVDTLHPELYPDDALILAVLDQRNLLFSEARQAVYELDDLSAHVWRCLDSRLAPEQIVADMVQAGAEKAEAAKAVAAAADKLREIELGEESVPSRDPIESEPLQRITLPIGGVAVQLNLPEALLAEVEQLLGYLKTDESCSVAQFSARLAGDAVQMLPTGQAAWTCDRAEFLPLVKALLIDSVLKFGRQEVALHAAALVREGKTVLLLGSPGTGKTTLAATLAQTGFDVVADDVVLLDDSGLITGLALPFTVKESAWAMLAEDWPALVDQPNYRRPDGIKVRYIRHDRFANPRPRRIGTVIILDRQPDGEAALHELGCVSALDALIAEGDARDGRLTETGFKALVTGLTEARCFRLSYSDRHHAAELVSSLYS